MRQTLRRAVRRAVSPLVGGLVGGLVMAVLLGGCGGGDGDATPTFSPSTTPTAVSTTASPVSPSTSATEVQETPEAFVRRWNEASTQMLNSGDVAPYLTLSQACEACRRTVNLVKGYYGAGGYIHTDGWKILEIKCEMTSAVQASCEARISSAVTNYRKSKTAAELSFAGGQFKEAFHLAAVAQGWTMTYIAQEAA